MNRNLIKYLISQELIYAGFCLVIAVIISFNHGLYPAIKAFGYCMLFLQPVIVIVNRKIILELFRGDKL